MIRTDAKRIDAYNAKYGSTAAVTTVGLKVAAQLPGMKTSYAAIANSLQPKEAEITQVLAQDNVPSASWGQYLAFGRELWKRARLGGDPALTTDAQIIYNKWKAYGAVDSVMQHVALDVFGITVV